MIHPLADVQSENIGENTFIWQFCIVLPQCIIGSNCNINCNVFIENDVVIGNNVTVKSGVQIWDGITLEDDVFIGPNVTFTNDLYPRSKRNQIPLVRTIIKKGASIGGNSTILAGNTIGEYALVGAGAVVTKNIHDFELWVGNPAKHVGYVTEQGEVLDINLVSKTSGKKFQWKDKKLVEVHKKFIQVEDITIRLIDKYDADFIIELRTDQKLGQNISWTSPNIDDQVEWINRYKKREANKEEFYFIFEDVSQKPWGTIRLYNFKKDSFTIGSWICLPGNKDRIAIKAWLLSVEYGFEKLGFSSCLFDVRKKNISVLYFAYLFHPEILNEDELNYYFNLDKDLFYKNRNKVIKLLQFKINK
jgi:acetyltransferase-like isoleucine patch superfamily enzyme